MRADNIIISTKSSRTEDISNHKPKGKTKQMTTIKHFPHIPHPNHQKAPDETYYAITGGIGSGKSFVCKRLEALGIKVYDCDAGAKRLMRSSKQLQDELRRLVGEDVYIDNVLQKRILAQYILESNDHAQQVDDIIHPAVARDFITSGLHWLESAIFFDSGFNKRVSIDKVICVTAPLETRIARIMKRDTITRAKAIEWIDRQLPQQEVLSRSDYEIVNDGATDIDQQIKDILRRLAHPTTSED